MEHSAPTLHRVFPERDVDCRTMERMAETLLPVAVPRFHGLRTHRILEKPTGNRWEEAQVVSQRAALLAEETKYQGDPHSAPPSIIRAFLLLKFNIILHKLFLFSIQGGRFCKSDAGLKKRERSREAKTPLTSLLKSVLLLFLLG